MNGSGASFLVRPKWIAFHVLVFAAVALMIWLGFWQLRRLDERRQFNATVEARIDQPAVPVEDLLASTDDPSRIEWRQVTATGTWRPDQIVWFNRSQGGIAGDNVLTALDTALDDGDGVVIVNRGFVPLTAEVPPPPSGEIEILGRVRIPAARALGELTDAADGPVTEVRRIDLGQLDEQIDGEVAPVYLDLIGSIPNVTAGDPDPVPAPTLSEGPHLSYAVQWFIFATAALLGWVLAVRRSLLVLRRPETVTDGPDEQDGPGSPPSAGDAVTTATT